MSHKIIQHHDKFDFESFFENMRKSYVGIDYKDFELFMLKEGKKHSFIASASDEDRIHTALNLIKSDMPLNEFSEISNATRQPSGTESISKIDTMLLIIVCSSASRKPLKTEEMVHITNFISELPFACDVSWGLADDPLLGEEIKIVLLANFNNL